MFTYALHFVLRFCSSSLFWGRGLQVIVFHITIFYCAYLPMYKSKKKYSYIYIYNIFMNFTSAMKAGVISVLPYSLLHCETWHRAGAQWVILNGWMNKFWEVPTFILWLLKQSVNRLIALVLEITAYCVTVFRTLRFWNIFLLPIEYIHSRKKWCHSEPACVHAFLFMSALPLECHLSLWYKAYPTCK